MPNPFDQIASLLTDPRAGPLDVRPLTKRLAKAPVFLGVAVQDVSGNPYVIDGDGRFWMLDGSGDVA